MTVGIVGSSPREVGELGKFWELEKLGEGWGFQIFWVSLVLLGEVDFPWVRVCCWI